MHPAIFIIAFPYSSFLSKKKQSKKRKKTHSCLIRISSAAQTYDFLNSQRTGNKSRQYRLNRSIDSYGWAGIIVELGLVPNVPKRFQKLKPFCLPGTLASHNVDKVSRRLHTLYFVLVVVSNRLCHSLLPKSEVKCCFHFINSFVKYIPGHRSRRPRNYESHLRPTHLLRGTQRLFKIFIRSSKYGLTVPFM